jgi:hypothetical protein
LNPFEQCHSEARSAEESRILCGKSEILRSLTLAQNDKSTHSEEAETKKATGQERTRGRVDSGKM